LFTLLNNTVSFALFSYGKLHNFVSIITLRSVVIVVKMTMGPIVAKVWVKFSHNNGPVTVVTRFNPLVQG
jgi:hypothetical protein